MVRCWNPRSHLPSENNGQMELHVDMTHPHRNKDYSVPPTLTCRPTARPAPPHPDHKSRCPQHFLYYESVPSAILRLQSYFVSPRMLSSQTFNMAHELGLRPNRPKPQLNIQMTVPSPQRAWYVGSLRPIQSTRGCYGHSPMSSMYMTPVAPAPSMPIASDVTLLRFPPTAARSTVQSSQSLLVMSLASPA